MAEQKRKISYGIDFEVNDAELKKLKKQLEQLKKLSVTNYANQQGIGLNNPAIAEKQANDLTRLKKDAAEFQRLMRLAYNPKTNSYNITKFNKILSQSNLEVRHFRAEMQKTVEGRAVWAAQTHELTKFNTEIKQSHKILDSLGKTLANTIKWTISSSLMQGVTRSISQAYGFAKNLDGALNDIRIVTGKSADEMARFAERANAVASNLGKGTNDYTRAALIYAQQGLGQKEIEEKTAITLKTANVTGQSAEEVSEELTAVWNGYKVSAEQAELYVDRLAAVASTTASNLQELSIGMSKVASAAATLGVGEDQLAAQLSTIISVTRQAPETVGTALRTVYARITDIKAGLDEDGVTLGKYSGDMAKIGINVLDLNGNLRNMGEVMEEIGNKWSTMTQEQKIYLAQTMAGQRQYSNLMALFDNFDKYESALNTAQNAEGKLQEQQDVYMDRLSTHVQQLTTATEHMWMGLVDTNGFKDVIDGLTTIVEKVDKLFQSIGGGKNLLQSLIPIVMSLTSKTVASGINTMIMNSQLEKRQLRDQRSSQVLAQKEMKDLQREGQQGSQRYQIFKQKSEFLQAAPGTFSAQQMDEINQRWSGSLEAAAEADKRKTELNQYSDITRSITTILGNNVVDLKETLSIEDLENAIIDVGGQYDELSLRIERYAQDQDEINKQQDAAQQQLTEAYLQTATKIKSAKVFSEENSQFKQLNLKNLKKYEAAQAATVSQKQQELDSLSGRFLGLSTTKKGDKILQSPLQGIFNIMQGNKVTETQMQNIESANGFKEVSAIENQKEKIKKIKEILENSIYKEIFDAIPPDQIDVKTFIKEVQNKFAEIEQLKVNAQKAIRQASEKQKAANQELLQRQQMQNVYQQNAGDAQALKNNLQIQNVDKFQNNLKFLSQDFSSITIPPELKTQLENTKKEYQELSQAITDYNQKVQSSSKLSQEQINALRQEKEALEKKQQTLLNTTQGIVNNINANVQNKGQQAIDGQKYSGSIINNNQEAIKDREADANRQKQLQGIMSTLAGVNMLTAAYSNLGNAIRGAFYEGNWEGFIGTMLTSLPMLIAGIAQLSTGFTALNSILSFDISLSIAQAVAKKNQQKAHRKLIRTQLMELQTFRNLNRVQQEAIITSKLEGSTKAGKAGVEGLTGAFSGLKTVIAEAGILLIPLVVAIAGLMAFKAVGDNRVKQAEAQLQANKKVIESENEKQNQIKKEQSVRKQVEALNEQYKKGIITRAELRDKTRELQQKYKDESKQIQKLIKDYKNLGAAAEQAKKKEANDLEKSTKTDHDTAANSLDRKMETMHVRVGFGNWTGEWDAKAKGQASIGGGGFGDSESRKLGKRLEAAGLGTFDQQGNTVKLKNAANGAQAYQQLKILQDFVNDSSVDKNSEAYKGAKEILDSMKQEMEQYESTIDQHMYAIAQQIATNTDISFEEVDSLKQYNQKYEELAQQMKSQMQIYYPDKTQEEINDVVDKVLAANIDTKLQDKFADKNEAIKKLENNKNLGKVSDEIKNKIEALDENQLDVFLRNNLETATSYTVIENALDKISQMDLSNIGPLTSNESIQKTAEAYERIQEAIEAIQNGKSISDSVKQKIITEGLISEEDWKKAFEQNINGSWVLKNDVTLEQGTNVLTQSVLENQRKGYNEKKKDFEGYQTWNKATEGMNKQYDFSPENSMVKYNGSVRFFSLIRDAIDLDEKSQTFDSIKNNPEYDGKYSAAYTDKQAAKKSFNTDLDIIMNNKNLALENMTQKQYNEWKSKYDKGKTDEILKDIIENERENLWISKEDLQKMNEETNEDKALKMIEAIKSVNNADDFVNISSWEELINQGKLDQAIFKQISEKYNDYIKTYSTMNIDEVQSKMQEYAQRMYNFEFPIDSDVDEKLQKQLAEQYQLMAEKSELLDKALKNNAKNAKDVAAAILRYQAAIDKTANSYSSWIDILNNGSTAEKIKIMPDLKDAFGDILDIDGLGLSNIFATTSSNLELMKVALEDTGQAGKQAYEKLQQLAQLDILNNMGLKNEQIVEIQEQLNILKDFANESAKTGAEISYNDVKNYLEEILTINKDITSEQLTHLLTLMNIDADLVVVDGHIQKINTFAKSATYELKQQQTSIDKLKDLQRERIKNQKELTKYLRDDRDLYHEINILLKDQERIINRITKNQDSMYGAELLQNLSAQTNELRKQQALLKSKQQMQLQDMANRKSALASQGAAFDSNGNIINYNNLIGSAMNKVNEIISRQNSIISAKNNIISLGGSTNDEAYKNLELQEFLINREKSNAQEYLGNLKSDLSAYESVKSDFEDVIDQLSNLVYQKIELRLKEFKVKVDVKYDLIQLQKDYDDFRRNIIEHDDILNPNKVKTILKDSAQYFSDALSSLNYLPSLADDLQKAINEANKFNDINYDPAQDPNAIFKTQGQAKTYLQQALEKVNSQSKDVLSNIDEIKNKILELANELKDVYTKQEQHLSFIREQINHDISLSKLLYGEENYKNLNKYYDQLKTYNLKSVEDAKSQQQMFLELYQRETDKALKDIYLQNYKQATKTLNSILESSLQDLKTRYENAINEVLKNTKEKLGFTYNTGLEWDLMKKQNDTFLDKVNSTFAIKNTEFLYNQAINDIDNISAQVKLKNVMNQQLEILKEKQQLTQYDVDRAQKVLDIQKARIALEQAQNNKTSMRLKRDSQGNYSYQFVADEDEIAKAQNNLDKTKNDLYNFDKEHYIENLNQAQELYEEYANKIREIKLNDNLNQVEKTKALGLLREDFEKRILKIWKQNEFIKRNLMDSTTNSLKMNLQNMSAAEQNYFMGQSIPMWDSAVQEILNKFIDDPNSVYNEINDMYSSLIQVQNDYQSSIDQSLEKAGTSYEQFKKTGIDPVVDSMKELIKNNNELAKEANTIVEEMQPLKTTLGSLTDKWEEMRKKIEEVNDQIKDYLINMGKAALAAQNNGNNGGGTLFSGLPTQLTDYSTSGSAGGGGTTQSQPQKSSALESKKKNFIDNLSNEIFNLKGDTGIINALKFEDGGKIHTELSDSYMAKRRYGHSVILAITESLKAYDYLTEDGQRKKKQDQVAAEFRHILQTILETNGLSRQGSLDAFVKESGIDSSGIITGEEGLKPFLRFIYGFDTGGYTGSWNSSDGKLAMLHQKELVLNKQDTKNILNAVSLVRTITNNLASNLMSQINSIGKFENMTKTFMNDKFNQIEQNVKIQANFPNVNSKQEIEDAFAELVNMAAQRALRKK